MMRVRVVTVAIASVRLLRQPNLKLRVNWAQPTEVRPMNAVSTDRSGVREWTNDRSSMTYQKMHCRISRRTHRGRIATAREVDGVYSQMVDCVPLDGMGDHKL